MEQILLSHGSGGEESNQLLQSLFFKYLGNDILNKYEDAASLKTSGHVAFSTDSFTVHPLFFNGGDIGKLSICGTCNDIAMMGARPRYVTCGFMIEEGFPLSDLEAIVKSMQQELAKNEALIVAGDTKVVPKGSVDGLFINTSGIGDIVCEGISSQSIKPGDAILVSGFVGEHGAEIFARREGMEMSGNLQSDCASLWPLVKHLLDLGIMPKSLRDATRGGLAAVLNEWAKSSHIGIEAEESAIPIRESVKGICEMLGFEAYNLANEGMCAVAVESDHADAALQALKSHELGQNAAIIAHTIDQNAGKVILKSAWGTKRYMETPSGELLPRIC